MDVFVVVFEDNMLEMADGNMIFTDRGVAEAVKDNYQKAYYSSGERKLFVRPMQVDTRTVDKLTR